MRALVLNINLEGNDISGFVESLKFDDSTEKDNTVTLSIKEDLILLFLNNEDLEAGNELVFNFGYIGGPLSATHRAVVSDISVVYGTNGVTATVTGLDKGHFSKKNTSKKIWQNMTASQIASAIGDKYQLEKTITTTTKVYENMPQGNRGDFDLLKDLALKENNFIFYVRGDELFFGERGLDKDSVLTFTYGSDEVISFRPVTKLSKSQGISDSATLSSFNASAKVETTVKVDNDNEEKVTTTTGVFINSDIGLFAGEKNLVKETDDDEEAKNVTSNAKKKDALSTKEATLTIEGLPNLKPNTIVTINNVAVRHLGNWLIKGVSQSVGRGGFTTTLQLTARGSRTGTKKGENNNKSTGGKEISDTKQLKRIKINSDLGLFAGEG